VPSQIRGALAGSNRVTSHTTQNATTSQRMTDTESKSSDEDMPDRFLPRRTYSTRNHNCRTRGRLCARTNRTADIEYEGLNPRLPSLVSPLRQAPGPTRWMRRESPWCSRFDNSTMMLAARMIVNATQIEKRGAARKVARALRKSASRSPQIQIPFRTQALGSFGRNFFFPDPAVVSSLTTTQVPHFGQVTHEHAMRLAILKLYCSQGRVLLPAVSTTLHCLRSA
jgi:hypothetical protein